MIPRGTIIFEGKPLAHVVTSFLQGSHCDYCCNKGIMKKCTVCQCVGYCNAKCQKEAWKIHKKECQDLLCYPDVSDDAKLLSRIIRKLNKNDIREKFYRLDGGNETFWNDEMRVRNFHRCFSGVCKLMGLSKVPKMEEVKEIYMRMYINSCKIIDYNFFNIGEALHLFPKTLKHSCTPNITYVYFEQTIIVTTMEDIPEINWDKLTICLIDPVQSANERKLTLKKKFFRECFCDRCIYPERDALCPNRKCRAFCSIEEDVCPSCDQVLTKEFKRNYMEVIRFADEKIDFESTTPENAKLMNACLKRFQKFVCPIHHKYIQLLEKMQVSERNNYHWMRALKYLDEILIGFIHYYGKFNFYTAVVQLQIAKLNLHAENQEEYNKSMSNAEMILCSLYGAKRGKEYIQQMMTCFAKQLIILEKIPVFYNRKCKTFVYNR